MLSASADFERRQAPMPDTRGRRMSMMAEEVPRGSIYSPSASESHRLNLQAAQARSRSSGRSQAIADNISGRNRSPSAGRGISRDRSRDRSHESYDHGGALSSSSSAGRGGPAHAGRRAPLCLVLTFCFSSFLCPCSRQALACQTRVRTWPRRPPTARRRPSSGW